MDVAAEVLFVRIERSDLPAFLGGQQLFDDCAAVAVEVGGKRLPIMAADALFGHRRMVPA